MDDDCPLAALVVAATAGDHRAWHELVDRYAPLLVSVIRRFRFPPNETDDVAQTVWLRLIEHLDDLKEPRALPQWIITTGRREALRHLSTRGRSVPHDPLEATWSAQQIERIEPDDELLRAERHAALLAGMAELPNRQRLLLQLFVEDPPLSYSEISVRTGIPVGSIGPTRARALDRLRATQPIRNYTTEPVESGSTGRRLT